MPRRNGGGGDLEVERLQVGDQRVDLLLRHVQHDHLLLGGGPHPAGAVPVRQVRDLGECGAVDPAHPRGEADVEAAVLLPVHPEVVAPGLGGLLRRGPVDQFALQVLVLEDLAELLRAPVRDQELQPGAGAQPTVAVVAEDPDDAAVDVGHLVQRHPGAEPHPELGVGGEAAADPEVEAGAVLRVVHPDEGDVVDLVRHVQVRGAGDRGLELAGQVGEVGVADEPALDLVDGRGAVDDLVLRDARDGRAEDDAGGCHRTPRWWTGRPLRAAARSPARPRCGSSGTARSGGRSGPPSRARTPRRSRR